MEIAVFGAGSVGKGLATLLRGAGHSVRVCLPPGSQRQDAGATVSFEQGAQEAEAVLLALPYTAAAAVLRPLADTLAGKIVIDCTNPLNADWSPLLLGQENSAAEEIARSVPAARVVKAFNTIFADLMSAKRSRAGGLPITAFVAADDAAAKTAVLGLARAIGFAPVDVGPLRIARHLEAMAHLNIQIAVGQGGGTHAAFFYQPVAA